MADDLTPAHRAAVEVMAKAMRQNVTAEPIPESTLASAVVRGAATAALRALIEAGFWVARWEPIETAPKDDVLVSRPDGRVRTATRMTSIEDGDTAWVIARRVSSTEPVAFLYEAPTHFMTLPPSPPEADNAE